MKKTISAALATVLAFLSLFAAGCKTDESSGPEIQSDRGFPIQYISMEKESIALSGIRGVTSQVLNVTFGPSNAQDKEVFWFSSDENVIKVERIGDRSCRAILMGNGTAKIVARNYTGSARAECIVSASLSSIKPFEPSIVSITPNSSSLHISWKTPEKNGEYLDATEISVYRGNSSSGILVAQQTLGECAEKGKEYSVDIENLSASTEYFVSICVVDKNGLRSDCATSSVPTQGAE